jgi:hypothetical protein
VWLLIPVSIRITLCTLLHTASYHIPTHVPLDYRNSMGQADTCLKLVKWSLDSSKVIVTLIRIIIESNRCSVRERDTDIVREQAEDLLMPHYDF